MGVLLSVFGFLITICVIVLIHEGGHYLAAKWLGFAVKRFSIGMGKVLWRFRRWDTEFAVSLLPIGGYVMFEEDEAGLSEAQRRRLFERGPRWKRAIVIAAGPLMNFVLAVALYAAAGAIGVEDIAPYVAAKPGTQAEAQGVAPMDRVIAVEGERIEGISDFNLALIERAGEPAVTITLARAGTAAAETGAKIDLAQPGDRADEIYSRSFDLSGLKLDDVADQKGFAFPSLGFLLTGRGIVVADVVADGPAARAGLKRHDFILEVDGERATMANFSAKIRASAGLPLELLVRGEACERRIVVTPEAVQDEKTGETIGRANLRYGPSIELVAVRHGPVDSLKLAFDKVARLTAFQFSTVSGMAKGEVSAENLSGPVGIADMAGNAVAAGISAFLEYIALISVAIGFMNLIPIPALDGGQLVILGVEGAIRRDLTKRVKEMLGAASFALLMLLAVYVTMNDVARLSGG